MLHCLFYLLVFNQPLPLTIAFFHRQVCGVALNLRPLLATTHEKRQPLQLSFGVERETGSLPHATLPVLSFGIQSTVTAHYCFFSSSGLRRCLKLAPPACYHTRKKTAFTAVFWCGAGDGIRTRDFHLGKVTLYH